MRAALGINALMRCGCTFASMGDTERPQRPPNGAGVVRRPQPKVAICQSWSSRDRTQRLTLRCSGDPRTSRSAAPTPSARAVAGPPGGTRSTCAAAGACAHRMPAKPPVTRPRAGCRRRSPTGGSRMATIWGASERPAADLRVPVLRARSAAARPRVGWPGLLVDLLNGGAGGAVLVQRAVP
jgi:hypothetical protein